MTEPARVVAVRRALAAFEPADLHQEQAFAQVEHLLLDESGDPCARSRVSPGHLTASGLVLSEDGQSLLLIFHRTLARWLQPGGHFELEDVDHLAAARREVREEVGIERLELVSSLYDLDVHEIPANSREDRHLHFDLRVLFRCRDGYVRASDEVAAARYFPLAELAAPGSRAPGSDDSVARVARRLLTRAR